MAIIVNCADVLVPVVLFQQTILVAVEEALIAPQTVRFEAGAIAVA